MATRWIVETASVPCPETFTPGRQKGLMEDIAEWHDEPSRLVGSSGIIARPFTNVCYSIQRLNQKRDEAGLPLCYIVAAKSGTDSTRIWKMDRDRYIKFATARGWTA